jgi:AcrR family transcriptional regulator
MKKNAREISHQAIVETAWALARNEGIASLTMAKIAKASGLTRQAVYWHFKSRTNLLFEVANFNDLQTDEADLFFHGIAGISAVESFVEVLKAWLTALPTSAPMFLALYSASLTDDDAKEALKARMTGLRNVIRDVHLTRIQAEGHLKGDADLDEAACFIFVMASPPFWQQITECLGWRHEFYVGYVIHQALELYIKPQFRPQLASSGPDTSMLASAVQVSPGEGLL